MAFSKTLTVGISVYSVQGKLLEAVGHENTDLLDRQLGLSGYVSGMYFINLMLTNRF